MATSMGQLKGDTAWSGEIQLAGDVFVPEGVTLRIEPGTRVSFAPTARWSCSVFWRSSEGGDSIEASQRSFCDIIVAGRLEVAGERDSQVLLGTNGTPWGGITCLGRGEVSLEHAHLMGAPHFSLQAFDDASVRGSECYFSGSEWGVWVWGNAQVNWSGGTIGATRASVICCEGSRARVRNLEDRSGEGVAATDWSLVRVEQSQFRGPRKHCVVARNQAWVKLRDCETHEGAVMDVVRLDDARVEVRP